MKFDFLKKISKKTWIIIGASLAAVILTLSIVLPVTLTPKKFTVSFDTHGGSAIESQTVKDGKNAMRPADDPTKPELAFTGWYISETGGAEFDFDAPIAADTTVHAQWSDYTISPAAAGITYGQTLSESLISPAYAVLASDNATQVPGVWSWANASAKPGAGSQTYQAAFTPADTNLAARNFNIAVAVAQKELTLITGITAYDKVYNGTAEAALNLSAATSPQLVPGDTLLLSGGTGTFADKNVGTNKAVTYTSGSISLSGACALNYTVNFPQDQTTTANISPLLLVVSAPNLVKTKTYDAKLTANVTAGTPANLIPGDNVNVSAAAVYSSANVGTGKTITVSYSISGTSAGNYTAPINNVYTDGAINYATPAVVSNPTAAAMTYGDAVQNSLLSGGSSSVPGVFAFVTPGVILTSGTKTCPIVFIPTDTTNYATVTDENFSVVVNPKAVTVSPTAGQFKIYGSSDPAFAFTNTSLVGAETLSGALSREAGESVKAGNYAYGIGSLQTANPNYAVTLNPGTFEIKKKTITGITGFTASKVYDGSVTATLTGTPSFTGIVGGDTLTITGGTAAYTDKNAGTGNKTVIYSGYTIGGESLGNYDIAAVQSIAGCTISKKAITAITGLAAINKTYDGGTAAQIVTSGLTLTGIIGTDEVSLTGGVGNFDDKNVAAGKTVTYTGYSLAGAAAGNYTLNIAVNPTAAADITALQLTIADPSLSKTKTYDALTAAAVTAGSLTNLISGDAVSIAASAVYDNKNAGTGKTITVTYLMSGAHAGNYIKPVDKIYSDGAIDKAGITAISGMNLQNKTYDGNTAAQLLPSFRPEFAGMAAGDSLTLASYEANFSDKNVGISKTVTFTGIVFGGEDADNYRLDLAAALTSTASIFKKVIFSIDGIVIPSRQYDGTADAVLDISQAEGSDAVAGDTFTFAGGMGLFADKNIGLGKTVTFVQGSITLTGVSDINYEIAVYLLINNGAALTADITAREITAITGLTASKTYNGQREGWETINTVTGADLAGNIDGSNLSASASDVLYADMNVGTGKTVTFSGLSLSGPAAANYTIVPEEVTLNSGEITAAMVALVSTSISSLQADPFGAPVVFTFNIDGLKEADGLPDSALGVSGNVKYAQTPTAVYGNRMFTVTVTFSPEKTSGSDSAFIFTITGLPAGGNYLTSGSQTLTAVIHGTPDNPILVTQSNFAAFNTYANTTDGLSRHYRLTEDVDFTGIDTDSDSANGNWTPIGSYDTSLTLSRPFTGCFDGSFKTVSGIRVNLPSADNIGFFGHMSRGATVKNLSLDNCSITGKNYVGGIVGNLDSSAAGPVHYQTLVERCSVSGAVSGAVDVGGIAGKANYGAWIIRDCSTSCSVYTSSYAAGGIVGYAYGNTGYAALISDCSSSGNITGQYTIGGIVGEAHNNITVKYCYSSGSIAASSNTAGGIAGSSGTQSGVSITNCVALCSAVSVGGTPPGLQVGKIIGNKYTTAFSNCYYRADINCVSQGNSYDGQSAPVASVTTQAWWTNAANWDAAAWDFYEADTNPAGIWKWDSTNSRPILAWQV